VSSLTDEEVLLLVDSKHIPAYKLEKQLGDYERGVAIRYLLILSLWRSRAFSCVSVCLSVWLMFLLTFIRNSSGVEAKTLSLGLCLPSTRQYQSYDVERLRGKIIRSILCSGIYDSCAQ